MLLDCCNLIIISLYHQASNLIESIENYAFWVNDYLLFRLKHEIVNQINNLPISIAASGFFVIDREHLNEVSLKITFENLV